MFAVLSVLIIVISAIGAPAAAAFGQNSSGPSAVGGQSQLHLNKTVSIDASPGPRGSFAAAIDELDRVNVSGPPLSNHLDRARSEYAQAFSSFEDPVQPRNESGLNAAKKGTNALHALLASSKGKHTLATAQVDRVTNASSLAKRGANRTARWQLWAAEWAYAAHEPNLDQKTKRQLRTKLDNARQALARAESVPGSGNAGNADGKKGGGSGKAAGGNLVQKDVKADAEAINQYRISWRHSTAVLDRIESSSIESTLSDSDGDGLSDRRESYLGTNASNADSDGDDISDLIETADGFPVDTDRDGTIDALDTDSDVDTIPDLFEGNVFTDRLGHLGIGGTNDTDGNGVLDFRDPDDDGDGIPTRTEIKNASNASVRHDVDFDLVPNWRDTDADGDGIPDGQEGFADPDSDGIPAYLDNDLDNDGLPGFYETNVTKTDPADPDSDSAVSDRNEADNGVSDGDEDFDNDTFPTAWEYRIGTSPFNADTDGDGLDDSFEANRSAYDPTVADTDGDGIPDGEEDSDGDGLSTLEEIDNGTDIRNNDTDGDGLNDGAEVEVYETDPLSVDTDGDGLDDWDEVHLGTDPNSKDSDGDGVLDGNETYESSRRDPVTNTTVSIRGEGHLASDVVIRPRLGYIDGDLSSGPTVQIEAFRNFSNASVTIPVNESVSNATLRNLSVFKWNGSFDEPWYPVETSVDIENRTVSTTVSSFSHFTVIDPEDWRRQTRIPEKERPAYRELGNFSCSSLCEPDGHRLTLEGTEATGGGNVSGPVVSIPSPSEADIVVSKSDNSTYDTIQSAVNASSPGDIVWVESGTYNESILVGQQVKIVGPDATLRSPSTGSRSIGFKIEDASEVAILGFTFSGYDRAISANRSAAPIVWAHSKVRESNVGLYDWKTNGDRLVHNITFSNISEHPFNSWNANGSYAISNIEAINSEYIYIESQRETNISFQRAIIRNASGTYLGANGIVRVRNVEVHGTGGTGIYHYAPSGSFIATDIKVSHAEHWGIEAFSDNGNITIRNVTTDHTGLEGIYASTLDGNIRITNAYIRHTGSESGWDSDGISVDTWGNGGDITIKNALIENVGYYGIGAWADPGNLTLESVRIHNVSEAISASGSDKVDVSFINVTNSGEGVEIWGGNATIEKIYVNKVGDYGIDAFFRQGTIRNITVKNTSGGPYNEGNGLVVGGLSGGLSEIVNAELVNNSGTGLVWDFRSDSNTIIRNSIISDNSNGSSVDYDAYSFTLRNNTIVGNENYQIINWNASEVLNATNNWWGRSAGPDADAILGPVSTTPSCSSPCGGANAGWHGKVNLSAEDFDYGYWTGRDGGNGGGSSGSAMASWNRDLRPGENATLQIGYEVDQLAGTGVLELTAESTTGVRTVVSEDVALEPDERGNVTLDLSSLGGQHARFTVSVEGANVTFSAPNYAFDSDGDGLSDYVERSSAAAAVGQMDNPLRTDPEDPDTDNDGIPDGVEIAQIEPWDQVADVNSSSSGGRVITGLVASPLEADSDSDGLLDREEVDGWEIRYADERQQAIEYNRTIYETNSADEARDILTTENVTSNPLAIDTDGDGVSDYVEQAAGTNPQDPDTDGDLISDSIEIESKGYPRLFDVRAPRIQIKDIDYAPARDHYWVKFTATDISGIDRITILKEGKDSETVDVAGRPTIEDRVTLHVDRGLLGATGTYLSGFFNKAYVTSEAVDRYGNKKVRVHQGRKTFAEAAEKIAEDNEHLGIAEGTLIVILGAGQSITDSGKILAESSAGVAVGSYEFIAGSPEARAETLAAVKEKAAAAPGAAYGAATNPLDTSVAIGSGLLGTEREGQQNPFPKNSKARAFFTAGWYFGSIQGLAAGEAAAAKIAAVAKSYPRVQRAIQATRGFKATVHTHTLGRAIRVSERLADRYDLPDNKRGKFLALGVRALDPVPIPKQQQIGRWFREDTRLGRWATNDVDSRRFQKAVEYLRRTGGSGKSLLSTTIARGKAGIADRLVSLRSHPIVQRRLTTAWKDDDVSLEEVREAVETIEDADHLEDGQLREILADAGDDGAEALSSMPSNHVDLLSLLDESPHLKALYIRNYNELAPDIQYRARRLVESEPGALRFAGEVDSDAFERLLRSDFSDTEIGQIIDGMSGRTFSDLADNTDEFISVTRSDSHLVLKGERYGTSIEVDIPDDGQAFISKYDTGDLTKGELGEKIAADEIPDGADVYKSYDPDTVTEPGPDIVYEDPDTGEIVVKEAKFLNDDGNFGVGNLGKTKDGNVIQMSDDWIDNVLREGRGIDRQTRAVIEDALNSGNLRKKISVYQNRPVDGKTIAKSIEDLDIDGVRLVKIGNQR